MTTNWNLTGSDKQISWATDILGRWDTVLEAGIATAETGEDPSGIASPEALAARADILRDLAARLADVTDAGHVIAMRKFGLGPTLAPAGSAWTAHQFDRKTATAVGWAQSQALRIEAGE